MDTLLKFTVILAWIAGVVSLIILLGRIVYAINYAGSLEEKRDRVRGIRGTFPIKWPGIIAVIAWSWVAATWVA